MRGKKEMMEQVEREAAYVGKRLAVKRPEANTQTIEAYTDALYSQDSFNIFNELY